MRIRTIKPEFWQHETLAALPDFTRLMAVALLNWADDEGYFLASPHVVRGAVMPFEDDSTKILRSLKELSEVGWIDLGKDHTGRMVGRVVNFLKHQRIDRPQASKLAGSTTFHDDSTNDREAIPDESLWEWKGNGREEEGNVPPSPQGGKSAAVFPDSVPDDPTKGEPAGLKAGSGRPKKKKGGAGAVEGLVFPEDWSEDRRKTVLEWVEFKRETWGVRYKQAGFAKLLGSLRDLTPEQLQATVDLSMANVWKGLFPEQVLSRMPGHEPGPGMFGRGPQKKEGGAAEMSPGVSRGTEAPEGWEGAMVALWGPTWAEVYAAWELMPQADQRQVRQWLAAAAKKEGGAA